MQFVFRDDDVNPSTNYGELALLYSAIKSVFPDATIISCVTLFSKYNSLGAVYSQVPFKNKPIPFFYDTDKFMLEYDYIVKENIASHGLYHVNHSKLSRDAQEMSILGSCKFLKTNLFCAPFNAFNSDTEDICSKNGIDLITKSYDWKSLEHEAFNPAHKYWYFHSWRLTPAQLKLKLRNNAISN
jgi:hypothetical protein